MIPLRNRLNRVVPPPPHHLVALVRTPPSLIGPIDESTAMLNSTVHDLVAMGVTFSPPACDVALAAENESLKVRVWSLELKVSLASVSTQCLRSFCIHPCFNPVPP